MKICHVIFSTNRLKYLTKMLNSISNFDFGEHEVHRILIDDYPRTRNDNIFKALKSIHDIDELILHEENKGLSLTWTEFFEMMKDRDYDYILHQEDDVVLKQKISIDEMISALNSNERYCSVILRRQPWYLHDPLLCKKETDIQFENYLLKEQSEIFSIITSIYPRKLVCEQFVEYFKFNLNEGMIMQYLKLKYNSISAVMSNSDGSNIIEHIGEETIGKRILENEPGWEHFKQYHPDKIYSSRTGDLIE